MVIDKKTSLVLHCPSCGTIASDVIHIFDFSGNQKTEARCTCGQLKAVCGRTKGPEYWLIYICAICEVEHKVSFKPNQFWGKEPLPIVCPDTAVQLGFISAKEVLEHSEGNLQPNTDILKKAMSNASYFAKPLVMLDVLEQIQQMMAYGKIKCLCGHNDVLIELLPDKVKLMCNNCAASLVLLANCEKDYLNLAHRKQLILASEVDVLKS